MPSKITNKTANKLIASNVRIAKSLPQRMKGLLGKDSLPPDEGLLISPCSSIHTVGMRFPIDVIFYDRTMRALAVVKGLKPYRITCWHPRARGVIELPAGTLSRAPVEPGDELVIE
ncbi:MAG: DUF192 domain-containing protein [Nitrospirota bacterium]